MEYISKIRERVEKRLALKLLPYMERVLGVEEPTWMAIERDLQNGKIIIDKKFS